MSFLNHAFLNSWGPLWRKKLEGTTRKEKCGAQAATILPNPRRALGKHPTQHHTDVQKKSPLEAAQMDPHIHSRNGPGMGIKKLLKKLVRVSEMPQN